MNTNRIGCDSSYRWVIAALVTTSFFMTFISRFAWPPLVPVVAPVLNIGLTEAMAYMTAFYIGYVVMQIPGGILADRFGPRLVLAISVAIQGAGTIGIGFIESYTAGFVLRILCGLAAGCVFSSCIKAVVTWFSPAQRGVAMGFVMTAPAMGLAAPNFIMPVLNDFFGWQGAFRLVGTLIIVFAAAIAVFMKDKKISVSGPRKNFLTGLKFVLSNRNTLLIAFAGLGIVWSQIGFASVANPYMTEYLDLCLVGAGRLMMVYGLIGIPVAALTGYISTGNISKKKTMIIASYCLTAVLLIIFGRLDSYVGVFVVICVLGILIPCASALASILLADSAGPEWAATAGGVGNCIFQIGALLSPLLIGIVRDTAGHHTWTWGILAAGAVFGIFFAMLVSASSHPSEETN
ncbi:MAG: MFS transporter [Spirochaetaceae bacterium]|nr:MFS transporter [Spirochaetaceae bacterium]